MRYYLLILFFLSACSPDSKPDEQAESPPESPYLMVLGIGQDGGAPQAGSHTDPRWIDSKNAHYATSLGLVDPASGKRWMFEATPDFRHQWYDLDTFAGLRSTRLPDGVFLTHAHIGHYAGLMFLGHESIGAQGVPVFALPKMAAYLASNGPWSQLVKYNNIDLNVMQPSLPVPLGENIHVTPFIVPHRQEFSEVAGFIIEGPSKRIGFIPDIDSWEDWDSIGVRLEAFLATLDIAFLDGTFYANGEIPGRDMSGFPHPFISHTMSRLNSAADSTKAKVVFIHLNHTNQGLQPDSDAYRSILDAGFRIAKRGELVEL